VALLDELLGVDHSSGGQVEHRILRHAAEFDRTALGEELDGGKPVGVRNAGQLPDRAHGGGATPIEPTEVVEGNQEVVTPLPPLPHHIHPERLARQSCCSADRISEWRLRWRRMVAFVPTRSADYGTTSEANAIARSSRPGRAGDQ